MSNTETKQEVEIFDTVSEAIILNEAIKSVSFAVYCFIDDISIKGITPKNKLDFANCVNGIKFLAESLSDKLSMIDSETTKIA